MTCAVSGCTRNSKSLNYKFHCFSFPSDEKLLEKWMDYCYRTDGINIKSEFICDAHFTEKDFANYMQYKMGYCKRLVLNAGAYPTVEQYSDPLTTARADKKDSRSRKELVSSILEQHEKGQLKYYYE